MAKLTLSDIAAGYTSVSTINANNALVEAAMENTLSRDGTSPNTMSANLDMNSNQVKNVTDPTDDQDASTKSYVDTLVASSVSGQITGTFSVGTSWDWTAQQDFYSGLRIGDTGQTDTVAMTHDGTDMNLVPTNTTDVVFRDGLGIRFQDSTDTDTVRMVHDGTDFVITGVTTTDLDITGFTSVDLKGNTYITWYDGAGEDFVQMRHTDTAFEIDAAGTGGGAVPVVFGDTTNVRFDAGHYIKEQAAAAADVTAYGQLWVKSDTPNTLWFTDDAGTDFEVAVAASGNSGSVTCNGFTTSPATTWFFNREGNMVRARANLTVSATSNTQEMGFSAGTIPAAFRPAGEVNMVYPITDNGAVSMGLIQFNTDGSIDFFKGAYPNTASTFTASGTKGFSNNIEVIYYLTAS